MALACKQASSLRTLLDEVRQAYQRARYEVIYGSSSSLIREGTEGLSREELVSRMSRRHAFMVCFLGFMENFGEQMQRANRTKEKGTVSAATKSEPLEQFEVGEGTKGGETARDGEVAPMLVAGKRQSDDSSSNGIAGAVAPIPSPSCRCRVPPDCGATGPDPDSPATGMSCQSCKAICKACG